MAKVFTFLMILAGVSVLLSLAGVQTGIGLLLDATGLIDSPQDFTGSNLFSTISSALTLFGVAGIIVGLFFRQATESAVLISLCILLLSFVGDFVSLLVYMNSIQGGGGWVSAIAALFLAPTIIGYTIAIVEFWRGTD